MHPMRRASYLRIIKGQVCSIIYSASDIWRSRFEVMKSISRNYIQCLKIQALYHINLLRETKPPYYEIDMEIYSTGISLGLNINQIERFQQLIYRKVYSGQSIADKSRQWTEAQARAFSRKYFTP